jgi:hypothetical protein
MEYYVQFIKKSEWFEKLTEHIAEYCVIISKLMN